MVRMMPEPVELALDRLEPYASGRIGENVERAAHGFLHFRPSDAISSSASRGPQLPAGYWGSELSFCFSHARWIESIQAQAASISSRRMNSVWSPAITSNSSLSYASGVLFSPK